LARGWTAVGEFCDNSRYSILPPVCEHLPSYWIFYILFPSVQFFSSVLFPPFHAWQLSVVRSARAIRSSSACVMSDNSDGNRLSRRYDVYHSSGASVVVDTPSVQLHTTAGKCNHRYKLVYKCGYVSTKHKL